MNQDKARDLFSAYFEGSLEPGLRQTLEQRMRNDAILKADYAAFSETFRGLNFMRDEEIEVPMYLSDRIATRLEQERASKPHRIPAWSMWMRSLAFGGLAVVALGGAFLSLRSQGQISDAGVVGSTSETSTPIFSGAGSLVTMSFRPRDGRTVVVSSGMTGREIRRFEVDASSPAYPFENKLPGTAVFRIEVVGERPATTLALPGVSTTTPADGSGTLRDLAVALADRYRMPVVLRCDDDQRRLSWKLRGSDVREAAATALKGLDLAVDQRGNGILNLSDR